MNECCLDAQTRSGYVYYGEGQWARLRSTGAGGGTVTVRKVSHETVPMHLRHRARKEYDGSEPVAIQTDSLEDYLFE